MGSAVSPGGAQCSGAATQRLYTAKPWRSRRTCPIPPPAPPVSAPPRRGRRSARAAADRGRPSASRPRARAPAASQSCARGPPAATTASPVADAVVPRHRAFLLQEQDVIQQHVPQCHERAASLPRLDAEASVHMRPERTLLIGVGRVHPGDCLQRQLPGQTTLHCAEPALRSASYRTTGSSRSPTPPSPGRTASASPCPPGPRPSACASRARPGPCTDCRTDRPSPASRARGAGSTTSLPRSRRTRRAPPTSHRPSSRSDPIAAHPLVRRAVLVHQQPRDRRALAMPRSVPRTLPSPPSPPPSGATSPTCGTAPPGDVPGNGRESAPPNIPGSSPGTTPPAATPRQPAPCDPTPAPAACPPDRLPRDDPHTDETSRPPTPSKRAASSCVSRLSVHVSSASSNLNIRVSRSHSVRPHQASLQARSKRTTHVLQNRTNHVLLTCVDFVGG